VDYRRRIVIGSRFGTATAEMEDHPHHFRVEIDHDGSVVLATRTVAVRHPWDLCAAAGAQLRLLVGMPLSATVTAVGSWTAARQQCTHQFDLAGLAVAAAASGRADRTYDVEVVGSEADLTAVLERDGAEIARWTVAGQTVRAPVALAGLSLGRGFLRWLDAMDDPDEQEAAFVLRRACLISRSVEINLDRFAVAAEIGPIGECWVYQPGRAHQAARVVGATQDLTLVPFRLRPRI
jgi:Protein of unknown function (DUF2889)